MKNFVALFFLNIMILILLLTMFSDSLLSGWGIILLFALMTAIPMTFILHQIDTLDNLTKRLEELEKNSIVHTADEPKEEEPTV
ncbi:hypothetical protein [Proteiniclasticum ruminis]|uniref:Uncharacterized protein n=1 Tax=Proteiniclasticum ruminis TaxID=398199 RepID=A0A1I5BEN5_9CLOT|nr:hypothetical protein [Proteiniclasticum ruminis]SFN73188.1 hypothetical protein SAMN04488695_104176 [Proteiniclasticum ruminis]